MKKILSIAFGLVLVLGLTACEKQTPANYYGKLRQECATKDSESCCLSSVETMEKSNFHKVSKDGTCDYGYKKNTSRCPDAFTWCEPGKIIDDSKYNQEHPKICTMDAKQCPDGSFVGRTGPNCEFAECPETKEPKPKIVPQNPAKIKPCTREYRPVCGQPPIPECLKKMLCKIATPLPKTYSNKCLMENDNAELLYKGKCRENPVMDCPLNYPNPFALCGTGPEGVIVTKKDENGCAIEYGCKNPAK